MLFLIHGDRVGEAALTAVERRAILAEDVAYGSLLRERVAYVLGEADARSPAEGACPQHRVYAA